MRGEEFDASNRDPRLVAARLRAAEPRGWRRLYRRGYSTRAPPDFARSWLVGHLPFQGVLHSSDEDRSVTILTRGPQPAVRVEFSRNHLDRLTEWDLSDRSAVVAHDSIWRGTRLELLGLEEYRFFGDDNGSIVEITVARKPVSFISRVGFALDPVGGWNSNAEETALLQQLDRECRESPRHLP